MPLYHIIGTPGSGKTTRLVQMVKEVVQEGFDIARICFTSFTRAAANEAKGRVAKLLGLDPLIDMPFFGTLHSLAFRFLGLNRAQCVTPKLWREFCNTHSYPTETYHRDDSALDIPEDRSQQALGDYLLTWYQHLTNRLARRPNREDISKDIAPGDQDDLAIFAKRYETFKKGRGIFDFDDILLEALKAGWVPPVNVCFVDEAQDLTALQVAMVRNWIDRRDCVLAYDEDQAIYGWAGADPQWLLNLHGEREFLELSHRLPRNLVDFTQGFISRNEQRYAKKVLTTKEGGEIHQDVSLSGILNHIAEKNQESWFLLARNVYLLKLYQDILDDAGILYVNFRGRDNRPPKAVTAFYKLAEGESVPHEELLALLKAVPYKGNFIRGTKTKIENSSKTSFTLKDLIDLGATDNFVQAIQSKSLDPLDFPPPLLRTYRTLYKSNGLKGLVTKPSITLSSIHCVKGMEADHVVILPHFSKRTAEGLRVNLEAERRVWYVGMTRAKKTLTILRPLKDKLTFDEVLSLPAGELLKVS